MVCCECFLSISAYRVAIRSSSTRKQFRSEGRLTRKKREWRRHNPSPPSTRRVALHHPLNKRTAHRLHREFTEVADAGQSQKEESRQQTRQPTAARASVPAS